MLLKIKKAGISMSVKIPFRLTFTRWSIGQRSYLIYQGCFDSSSTVILYINLKKIRGMVNTSVECKKWAFRAQFVGKMDLNMLFIIIKKRLNGKSLQFAWYLSWGRRHIKTLLRVPSPWKPIPEDNRSRGNC
jgi:hypothetical protein